MAELGDRGRNALNDAAERLEMVARGVRSRHVAEVQGAHMPPSSTVYVRSEDSYDRPFMSNPAEAWAQSLPASKTIPISALAKRDRRTRLPWLVRWVMGWP